MMSKGSQKRWGWFAPSSLLCWFVRTVLGDISREKLVATSNARWSSTAPCEFIFFLGGCMCICTVYVYIYIYILYIVYISRYVCTNIYIYIYIYIHLISVQSLRLKSFHAQRPGCKLLHRCELWGVLPTISSDWKLQELRRNPNLRLVKAPELEQTSDSSPVQLTASSPPENGLSENKPFLLGPGQFWTWKFQGG